MSAIDAKVRHVTARGANLFAELGLPPTDARRLATLSRREIDDARALKEQLMAEVAAWIVNSDQ